MEDGSIGSLEVQKPLGKCQVQTICRDVNMRQENDITIS